MSKFWSVRPKEVVGTFQKKKGFGFVVPDDRKLTEDIYIKQDAFRSAANGDKVVAKITQYPDKQHRIEGKITEIVARKGETGSDVLSLIRGYGLFQTFPSRVNAEAKARGKEKNHRRRNRETFGSARQKYFYD